MILEIIIICLVGTLLHFTYEMSHHNKFVAYFSAVNESTWEHIKIALTPTFIYAIVDYFLLNGNNFFFGKFICMLTILIMIPILFYSYSIFTKKSILPLDVVCFYTTITTSQIISNYVMNLNDLGNIYNIVGIVGIIIVFIMYSLLSYFAPKNFIFKDPITHKYGLEGHPCHEHGHHHGRKHSHEHHHNH